MRSMYSELVKNKSWLDNESFERLKVGSLLLPGLVSTGFAMKVGYALKGVPGFILAGLGFIFPGLSILLIAALYYKELGQLQVLIPFLYGLKPAVLAIMAYTIIRLIFRYLTGFSYLAGFLVVVAGYFIGFDIIFLLLLAICVSVFFTIGIQKEKLKKENLFPLLQINSLPVVLPAVPILSIFIKIGFFIAGSGFVILAFAKSELVDKGWMTIQTLLDSIAISLFVPGPIIGLAGFIGYQVLELHGALLAVVGILIPTILFAIIGLLFKDYLSQNRILKIISNSWHAGTLGYLTATVFQISYTIMNDYKLWIIGIICLLILLKFPKMQKAWILIIGANMGYLLYHFLL